MSIADKITVSPELDAWMRETRRYIHMNPELSLEESNTSKLVSGHLKELGVSIAPGSVAMGAPCSWTPRHWRPQA